MKHDALAAIFVLLPSLLVSPSQVPPPLVAARASADAPLNPDAHADPEQRITDRLRRMTLEEGLPTDQYRQQGSGTPASALSESASFDAGQMSSQCGQHRYSVTAQPKSAGLEPAASCEPGNLDPCAPDKEPFAEWLSCAVDGPY
jgi:hypothetical protein